MSFNYENTINTIKEKLVRNYSPKSIILFGSYSEKNFDEQHSDIDLLIIKETSDRFIDRWMNVKKILSDPKQKTPIETIIITPEELKQRLEVGDQFFLDIIKNGKILYEA